MTVSVKLPNGNIIPVQESAVNRFKKQGGTVLDTTGAAYSAPKPVSATTASTTTKPIIPKSNIPDPGYTMAGNNKDPGFGMVGNSKDPGFSMGGVIPTYSGTQNVIGHANPSNPQSYTNLYNNSPEGKAGGQLNAWTDNNGNVYDTTNMTPQQIFALQESKNSDPNASKVLSGMGLDVNGNPTVPSSGMSAAQASQAPSIPQTGSIPQYPGYASADQQAAAQLAQQRAGIASSVASRLAALKNAYDYANQVTQDNRVLENGQFQRSNDPTNGRTGYLSAQLARNRQLADTQANQQYNANVADTQSALSNFDAGLPAQEQALASKIQAEQQAAALDQAKYKLEEQNQKFNQAESLRNDNWNAAQNVSDMTGKVIHPQEDWSGLYRQANDPNTPYTQAGLKNYTALTGYMPDGTPTNDTQKQALDQLWKFADENGTIPNQLADMYGLPHGTMTLDAKNKIEQLAISRKNADTSAFNAQTSRQNSNLAASNANKQQTANGYASQVVGGFSYFDNLNDAKDWLKANESDIVKNIGQSGYNSLVTSAEQYFPQSQKQVDPAIRQKAVDAAMKDYHWANANTPEQQQAIINQYIQYYTGG